MYLRSIQTALALSIATAACLLVAHELLLQYQMQVEATIFIVVSFMGMFASLMAVGFMFVAKEEWADSQQNIESPNVDASDEN